MISLCFFIFTLALYFFLILILPMIFFFFFFNDTATTEIYPLSLPDALPIYRGADSGDRGQRRAAARLPAAAAPPGGRPRRPLDLRRDDHRVWTHGEDVRDRARGRRAGRDDDRQGVRRRLPDERDHRPRGDRLRQAVRESERKLVLVRRQPAGRGGGANHARDHPGGGARGARATPRRENARRDEAVGGRRADRERRARPRAAARDGSRKAR